MRITERELAEHSVVLDRLEDLRRAHEASSLPDEPTSTAAR
jgi:hypothetical protein